MAHVSGNDLTARAALTPDDAAALALTLVEAAICPGVPDVLTQAEREVILSIPRSGLARTASPASHASSWERGPLPA